MSTGVVTPIRRSEQRRADAAGFSDTFARRRGSVLIGLAAAGLIVPLAAAQGGYFATAWGWTGLVLLAAAAIALSLLAEVRLSTLELSFAGGLAGLLVWTIASNAWTIAPSDTPLEAERGLVYVAAALLMVIVLRRRMLAGLVLGLLAGITIVSAYSLATRLFPERLGTFDPVAGYRLSEPIGYWNALGAFAAMGTLLALCFALRSDQLPRRIAGSVALVVLVPTLYFTFGRGGWIALGVGLLVAVLVDPRRLQLLGGLLFVAPAPALAVALAARSPALTRLDATTSSASTQGHRLAIAVLGLTVVAAFAAWALREAERRITVPAAAQRAVMPALALLVVIGTALVFVRLGGPAAIAHRAYTSFGAQSPNIRGDLNRRLFNLASPGRKLQWQVAWHDVRAHPWFGSGAGSYERYWTQHRPVAFKVRDVHNLYLETLAELGPLGLALLVLALAAPIAAALRTRAEPAVPFVLGAYAAYLVHAGADWDWEVPAVTLAALACGAALLVHAHGRSTRLSVGLRTRIGMLTAVVALLGFAFVGLISNSALSASASARYREPARSEQQARKASGWAAWSAQPWQALGETELAHGRLQAARTAFARALTKDRNDWELWLDLAFASKGTAQRRALAHATKLNPLSPEVAQFRRSLRRPRGTG
jgi:O-antigen ligase